MTIAFVLSGGGSLGAVQVGMLAALSEAGVEPDLLVGTSAGAMNAAWVATHGTGRASLDDLARIWIRLRRSDVFPASPRQVMRGVLGQSTAIASSCRLRRLVSANIPVGLLEDAPLPVHLLAADLLTGETVRMSGGSLVTAVLASAAVPGVLPPVARAGQLLVDGGVARHDGVEEAVRLGATVVYVLPTGATCAPASPPGSAIGVALHALTLLIQRRLEHEVATLAGAVSVKVLPPLCPLAVSAADFGHGAELVRRGHRSALQWLTQGGIDLPEPDRFLSAHHHTGRVRRTIQS